jgi:4-hydroxymandelate oxidase
VSYANLQAGAATTGPPRAGESGLAVYVNNLLDPSLSWSDLDWLVSRAPVPVLVKGVVRADDARLAVEHGAAGVVVSNHGGRQLDHSVATLDALPEVAGEVGAEVPVLMDGGVRRGTDVLKALALGARAVLIGRPYLWALVENGEDGVAALLEGLRAEVGNSLALLGLSDINRVTRDLVTREG